MSLTKERIKEIRVLLERGIVMKTEIQDISRLLDEEETRIERERNADRIAAMAAKIGAMEYVRP